MISASMIVRDAAATIERCIASIRPYVDEVCILDTGSVDGTLELLAELAAQPGAPIRVELAERPGHFGKARTMALELVEHDWTLVIDADEELVDGQNLRRVVADADAEGATSVIVQWHGWPGRRTDSSALFRRTKGRWQGAVHERWLGGGRVRDLSCHQEILIMHFGPWKPRRHYEQMMIDALDDPDTPQAAVALGLLYARRGWTAEARPLLEGYLQGPGRDTELRAAAQEGLQQLDTETPAPIPGQHEGRWMKASEYGLVAVCQCGWESQPYDARLGDAEAEWVAHCDAESRDSGGITP